MTDPKPELVPCETCGGAAGEFTPSCGTGTEYPAMHQWESDCIVELRRQRDAAVEALEEFVRMEDESGLLIGSDHAGSDLVLALDAARSAIAKAKGK